MTHWAFAVDEVVPLGDVPAALVLPVSAFGARDALGDQRRRWRRAVLTALAVVSVGIGEADVALVAGPDGRRRLGGTDLFASVAHRGGWVAAVLARAAVGVDLERPAEADRAADVILAGVDGGVDRPGWHGLAGVWATREAVLKAAGRDLTRDYRRWRFGTGTARGDDEAPVRVDLAARPGIVAAVAYAGG